MLSPRRIDTDTPIILQGLDLTQAQLVSLQRMLRIEAWHAEAKNAEWATPAEVKSHYGHASILKDGRVVFNICGNKYRLVVWINYDFFTIYVRFVGTHAEYDEIDAQTI